MPRRDIKSGQRDEAIDRTFTLGFILTQKCNLNCKYCYEKNDLRDERIVDIKILKENIEKYMKRNEFDSLVIDLFGGEPLIAFNLIKEIVEWMKNRKWKKNYLFSIGSNGTLLNDEIKKWLVNNKDVINFSISIDGCKKAHDINRSNSFDKVYPHFDYLREYWSESLAKMTISKETIPFIYESVVFLEKERINFTSNIVFENIWGDKFEKEKLMNKLEEELEKLIVFYTDRIDLYPVTPLLGMFPDYLFYMKTDENRAKYCGSGHEMVSIDIDGKEYPCHRFVTFSIGRNYNVSDVYEMILNKNSKWKNEKCNNCKLLSSCPTCIGFNFEENGDVYKRTEYHCEAFKLQVLASAKLEMNRILKKADKGDINNEEKIEMYKKLDVINRLIEEGI